MIVRPKVRVGASITRWQVLVAAAVASIAVVVLGTLLVYIIVMVIQ